MARRSRKRSYGSGALVPPQTPGGTWGVRLREGTRRPYIGGFATRELAERVLAKLAGDAAFKGAGLPPDPRNELTIGAHSERFLERREKTHRAGDCDSGRWKNHVGPFFDHLKPSEVDKGRIRAFVEVQLADGLSSGTVRIHVALLSALFTELVEDGLTQSNPARGLPRSTRRLIKPSYDPRTTPFIEKLDDVKRIYLALPEPLNVAFAVGAFAGLRTGEVFALKWSHIDIATRRIHVRESVEGPLKDKESRVTPILDPLLPVITAWKLKSGGEGLVVPPLRRDGNHIHKETRGDRLRAVLEQLGLKRDGLGWYECTRHTFASQWVLSGGSIEKLKEMLGHHSVVVTERYAHLRVDLFTPKDLTTIAVDLSAGAAAPVQLPVAETAATGTADPVPRPRAVAPARSRDAEEIGQYLASTAENRTAKPPRSQQKSRSSPVSRERSALSGTEHSEQSGALTSEANAARVTEQAQAERSSEQANWPVIGQHAPADRQARSKSPRSKR